MKPRHKMTLGMFLLVLGAGALSAGILYVEGSQAAVYAQVAVVPLLVVVGYLWVNRTVKATGTSRTEFERRKARKLGEQFSDVWQLAQQLENQYEDDGITDAEWEELERYATELESSGIAIDRSTGSFDISNRKLGTLEEINRLENETESLDEWLLGEFTENVRNRITAVNTTLDRLSGLVSDPETVDQSAVPEAGPDADSETSSWHETGNWLADCYQAADEVIEEGCGAIQEALMSTEDTVDPQVEQLLSDARQAGTARQYDEAVAAILDARDAVERDTARSFDDQQDALETLLATASGKSLDRYLGPSFQETLDEYRNELASFDDAIEIAELRQLREDVRESCTDIVDELQGQLDTALETLESADVPDGWYERPPAAETNYVRTLQAATDIAAFHGEFDTAVDSLLGALDAVKPKAGVVTGFDRMESQITETLRTEGVVTEEDLPVSELQEQFLGLYYRKHMDEVEFDPDVPRLSMVDGGESYDVHVTVAFPEGGQEREVTVTLDGKTTLTETCRTPLVAEASFADVPYGEYTVRVEPTDEEYSAVERTVTVEDDVTVEIELEQLSLRDQLCDGVAIDIDQILSNLSTRFETTFDDEGYLSTAMSFPVDEEYVPCLMAVWAQRQGYEATRYDGDVIVYDAELLRKEIENVVRYNLDVGDAKTYDELRSNFLSAPVADSTVEELVRSSTEQDVVTVDETGLTKEEES